MSLPSAQTGFQWELVAHDELMIAMRCRGRGRGRIAAADRPARITRAVQHRILLGMFSRPTAATRMALLAEADRLLSSAFESIWITSNVAFSRRSSWRLSKTATERPRQPASVETVSSSMNSKDTTSTPIKYAISDLITSTQELTSEYGPASLLNTKVQGYPIFPGYRRYGRSRPALLGVRLTIQRYDENATRSSPTLNDRAASSDTLLAQSGPVPLPSADLNVSQLSEGMAEGEGFEPPRASRPGGFQVHCLTS